MKMNHRFVTAFVALAALMTAPIASAKKPDFAGPPSGSTIVETAIALSGTPNEFDTNGQDFDILVAAVVATGINVSVLNGEYDYTVFAPNDQAFVDLCEVLTDSVLTEEDCFDTIAGALGISGVAGVLAYHVADGVRNSISVQKARSVKMYDGNRISARNGFIEANGSDANFLATDIRVADGMIHVIDFVLLPSSE